MNDVSERPGASQRLTGSLEGESYPVLLRDLLEGGLSGTLVLRRRDETREVHFHAGRVVFARSSNPDDRLGEFLLRRGVLGVQEYLESAKRIGPDLRQGTVLCAMQSIALDDLPRYVKEQMMEIVCSSFCWEGATYEIRPSDETGLESIVMTMPLPDIMLRGVRFVSDWGRIWPGVGGSIDAVFAPGPAASTLGIETSLSDDESEVLSLVNGRLSLRRLLELSYASDFETCRILWALRLVGAIVPVVGDRTVEPQHAEDYALADVVEAYDRLFFEVHEFVTERIGELVDHFMNRAVQQVIERHPRALTAVDLRNQGRVEYEQVLANLASIPAEERRRQAASALADLLQAMIELTARELGPEEVATLRERLGKQANDLQGVVNAADPAPVG